MGARELFHEIEGEERDAPTMDEVDGPKVQITERDRALVGLLGLARYLRSDQIGRLVFPGRHDTVVWRRLAALSGHAGRAVRHPCVARVDLWDRNGKRVPVWKLTERGYYVASQVLGFELSPPVEDVGAQALEHWLRTNEIFVALMATTGKEFARARRSSFKWIGSERLALPWSQYDRREGRSQGRLIRPDAGLEISALKRRIFIEYESGAHALSDRSKRDSTVSKLERYSTFLFGLAEYSTRQTWYAKSYPDGWEPEVVFVAETPSRRDSIQSVIEEQRKQERRLPATAVTLTEACKQLRSAVGEPSIAGPISKPNRASPRWLTDQKISVLTDFFHDATKALQRVRHEMRDGRPITTPQYPAQTAEVKELLAVLKALKGKG